MSNEQLTSERLVDVYLVAKNAVINAGFLWEIKWQESRRFEKLTEKMFLSEAAWVILAGGMKESVIRMKFPSISEAFCSWESARVISKEKKTCRQSALRVFGHEGKVDAIITISKLIAERGFPAVKMNIRNEGAQFLSTMPYLGPATSLHLAKNIGLNVPKPDRHLCRIARATGHIDPANLCRTIGEYVADSLAVIDIVLWRYATLERNYEHHFASLAA